MFSYKLTHGQGDLAWWQWRPVYDVDTAPEEGSLEDVTVVTPVAVFTSNSEAMSEHS